MFNNKRQQQNPGINLERESMEMNRDIAFADIGTREDNAYLAEQNEREDLVRWQQDLTDELITLKYNLKNYIKDENNEWTAEQIIELDSEGNQITVPMPPLLNDLGISRMISLVRVYLSRNVMMSSLTQEIIWRVMKGLVTKVVVNLGENYDRYGMREEDFSIIVKMIKDSVEPTLYRALNNGERNYIKTTNKRIETFSDRPEPTPRKGLFGMSNWR